MSVDIMRSRPLFDPMTNKEDIHVIGVGATGSHFVDQLASHGVHGNQIHVYDFDVVESHNVSNQIYNKGHVGMPKVEALAAVMKEVYGIDIVTHNVRVENMDGITGVVCLLIDGRRKPLFESMRYNPDIKLLIETGLDARAGRVELLDPSNMQHVKYFEKTQLEGEAETDDELNQGGEVSVCGTRLVVKATVSMLSAAAMWEFIRWNNGDNYVGMKTYISCDPFLIMTDPIN